MNCPFWPKVLAFSNVYLLLRKLGVNFTNILLKTFLDKSGLHSFSLFTVWLCNFLAQEYRCKSCFDENDYRLSNPFILPCLIFEIVNETDLHAHLHDGDDAVGRVDRVREVVILITQHSRDDGEEHVEEGEDGRDVE